MESDSQNEPRVAVTQDGGVAIVRLNRPPANAIELETARELTSTLQQVAGDAAVEAVVLTGTGKFFSAGLDLKIVPEYDPPTQRAMVTALGEMVVALYTVEKPVVAAINGHAVAAGTLMTLATDYRVACRGEVRFGLTGVRVGIPYPAAAMAIISAELAPADRRYMLLGARTMAAAEAVARGIVDELQPFERVLDRSLEVARDLATTPQASYASTKLQIRRDTIAQLRSHLTEDPAPESWLPSQ